MGHRQPPPPPAAATPAPSPQPGAMSPARQGRSNTARPPGPSGTTHQRGPRRAHSHAHRLRLVPTGRGGDGVCARQQQSEVVPLVTWNESESTRGRQVWGQECLDPAATPAGIATSCSLPGPLPQAGGLTADSWWQRSHEGSRGTTGSGGRPAGDSASSPRPRTPLPALRTWAGAPLLSSRRVAVTDVRPGGAIQGTLACPRAAASPGQCSGLLERHLALAPSRPWK